MALVHLPSVNPRPNSSRNQNEKGLIPIKKKLEEKGYEVTDFYQYFA